MVVGLWSTVPGMWFVVCGMWLVVCAEWWVVNGLPSMVSGQFFGVYESWPPVHCW